MQCSFAARPVLRERIDSASDRILAVERPESWGLAGRETLREYLLAEAARPAA